MATHEVSGHELLEVVRGPQDIAIGDVVVVDGLPPSRGPALSVHPCVVVGRDGWSSVGADQASLVDVIVDDLEAAAVLATVGLAPVASVALAILLRDAERRSTRDGLIAESALYSALLAGPEFAAWRKATPVRRRPPADGPSVRVERLGDVLEVTLDRPELRNALGVDLRDDLLAALAVAQADPAVTLELRGSGPAFCSGGHLDEFGTAPDPATAHLVRLVRSIGAALDDLSDRTTAYLHGACYGSGIELPAFCGRVVAAADTTVALPELGLGLIPGAGGTVSLPRRIGRLRTAWLAFTRVPIDVRTALDWGLVDAVSV